MTDRIQHPNQLLKLDLGGGLSPAPGYFNLDPVHGEGLLQRRAQDGFPFDDNSLSDIRASHFLEHIPAGSERINLFNECHRCLHPDGHFEIIVPLVGYSTPDDDDPNAEVHHLVRSWRAYADPTHVSYWWFPHSLLYFTQDIAHADYGILPWRFTSWKLLGETDGYTVMQKVVAEKLTGVEPVVVEVESVVMESERPKLHLAR